MRCGFHLSFPPLFFISKRLWSNYFPQNITRFQKHSGHIHYRRLILYGKHILTEFYIRFASIGEKHLPKVAKKCNSVTSSKCRMKATEDFFRRARVDRYRLKADKKYEPVPTINLQRNVFNDCGGESCQKRGIFSTTDQTDWYLFSNESYIPHSGE